MECHVSVIKLTNDILISPGAIDISRYTCLHYTANMDFMSLSVDLTFSNTATTQCVDVSTIFTADMITMPFNVNLTTGENPTAVSLNPAVTTVTIQDGRQLYYNKNSAMVHA